jgi:alpha,alpha-trehalase
VAARRPRARRRLPRRRAAPAAAPAPDAADVRALYEPSRDLGPLFADVQTARLFADGKTFVDARPLRAASEIGARYLAARGGPGFSIRAFVDSQFAVPGAVGEGVRADTTRAMEAHIRALWPVLTHDPDRPDLRSSLIPLPYVYVVPGGRFREVYYWDSYFTMLGLVESGRAETVRSMLDNFASLVNRVGHVPNGNRTYYLSRSQPPYFAAMVGLYARAADTARALRYLPALEREHAFWMDGAERLRPGTAYRRAVRLPDGALLNRYYDDRADPRPESYREDEALGRTLPEGAAREGFYRNTRAGAESGWDFSSRWMRDPRDLRTLEVLDLAPVDLNALLYNSERTIAAFRRARGGAGDAAAAARFDEMARRAGGRSSPTPSTRTRASSTTCAGERPRACSTGPRSPRPPRSTSAWRPPPRGAARPTGSGATSCGRAGSSPRSSPRGSSGTRPTGGRRCSGWPSRARAGTAAPTSPTRRARAGSASTGACTPRPAR